MKSETYLVRGISGGYPVETYGNEPASERGWIVMFPNYSTPVAMDGHPLELIVTNFDDDWNGEKDPDHPVEVVLRRSSDDKLFPGNVLWQGVFRRSELKERPSLIKTVI